MLRRINLLRVPPCGGLAIGKKLNMKLAKLGAYSYSNSSSSSSTRSMYWLGLALTTTALCDTDRRGVECQPLHAAQTDAASGILVRAREDTEDLLKEKNTSTLRQVYKKMARVVRYMQRLFMYALLGLPAVAIVPTAYAASAIIPSAEEWGWSYMIWAIEQLGPTFIKLAQWASTRPDLYPPSLVEKLQKLQDNVSVTYPMAVVEQTLAEAFGADWRERLQVESKPLGAGCVAQVFRGVLSSSSGSSGSNPVEVAVKMIHPHVEALVKTDMELLSGFASLIDKIPSLEILSLSELANEFADMMMAQLDLRLEASNLAKFTAKFAADKFAVFPQPIEGYVRKNVLVETLMGGEPIVHFMMLPPSSNKQENDKINRLKLKLSDLGTRLMLKMIFFDNFVHGDLHPGNLMVQIDKKSGEPRLVVLDCGIVYSTKSEADHETLTSICIALMNHDGFSAARLMMDKSMTKFSKGRDKEGFCSKVQELIDEAETQRYFEHLGEYVTKVCTLARNHNVRLDPSYFHVAMALKVVEGISLSLDKELCVVSKCIPIIMKSKTMRLLGIQKFPTLEDEEREYSKQLAEKSNKSSSRK